MKILVVNCGSSSVKFQLIVDEQEVIAKGGIDRIGQDGSTFKINVGTQRYILDIPEILDHEKAIDYILNQLLSKGVLNNLDEIDAIGHRVVHGGHYKTHVKVTNNVIEDVEYYGKFAPLHNPIAAKAMRIFKKLDKMQVAVFDTAFHQTMEEEEYSYAIPSKYSSECRRYGAHGINHEYVARRIEFLTNGRNNKLIVCHLGNGSSLCAVDENGLSKDTTMGLGPLGGLVMGTRSGDLDPTVVKYIADTGNFSIAEVYEILNKESGMLALSELSSDFIKIIEASEKGNEKAIKSLNIYCKTVAKYIAQMEITLGGSNIYAFTGGIGENSPFIREKICELLEFKGVKIDKTLNESAYLFPNGKKISTQDSLVDVYVIPANEEIMIATKTAELI